MKAIEILSESITFHPATLTKNSKGYDVIGFPDGELEKTECYMCDGTGKDQHSEEDKPCWRCEGKGWEMEEIPDGPELNVSNSNGYTIQKMLGLEPDYSGFIDNKHLPKLMAKLMKLANKDTSDWTKDKETSHGDMEKQGTDGNVTSIGHKGPTMIDMGRSQNQIDRYVERMMEIVQYAQKKGYHLSWG